jgi:hypothetical protein
MTNLPSSRIRNVDEIVKSHPHLIGVGVVIGIGVEKAIDQLPIPIPTATPTYRVV